MPLTRAQAQGEVTPKDDGKQREPEEESDMKTLIRMMGKVVERLDAIQQRLENVEQHMENMGQLMGSVEQRMDGGDKRVVEEDTSSE